MIARQLSLLAARTTAVAAIAMVALLASQGAAGADASAPTAATGSASAAPTTTAPTSSAPASAAPVTTAPTSSAPVTAPSGTVTKRPFAPAGKVLYAFDPHCDHYGFELDNDSIDSNTVTLTLNGVPEPPIELQPGEAFFWYLDQATPAGTEAVLSSTGGQADYDVTLRFCIEHLDHSVTISSNSSYTLQTLGGVTADPKPAHGTVVRSGGYPSVLIYRPDPCFSGTDHFGYQDLVAAEEGTVTVTVRFVDCEVSIKRTNLDCAGRSVSYTATSPYSMPLAVTWTSSRHPGAVSSGTIPAKGKTTLVTFALGAGSSADRITFRVVGTTRTLFTDDASCPAVVAAAQIGPVLASTGSPIRTIAVLSGLLLMLGTGLLVTVRRRNSQ